MDIKTYTGIGSRDAPVDMGILAYRIGYQLAKRGVRGLSGNSGLMDVSFETGAHDAIKAYNLPDSLFTAYLPWVGWEGKYAVDDSRYIPVIDDAKSIALHLLNDSGVCNWQTRLTRGVLSMYARNVYQILDYDWSKTDIVIYWAPEDTRTRKIKGGTRIAVEFARHLNIPTFNLGIEADKQTLFKLIDYKEH